MPGWYIEKIKNLRIGSNRNQLTSLYNYRAPHQHEFSEARLKTAWRNQTNQEIAASIIGYIRQAALNEALIPFDQRVSQAMQSIYANQWTPVQRKWLERLSMQLTHEVVIDETFVNRAFAQDGGAKKLNNILGKKLEIVLTALSENLWEQTA